MLFRNHLLLALLITIFINTNVEADSLLGRDVDNNSHTMYSLFVKYLPTAYVMQHVYEESSVKHDAPVLEIGWNQTKAVYTRLFWSLDVYGRMIKVDDSLYGDGDNTVYGIGVTTSALHRTFFGQDKSYDISLGIGLDATGKIELTDKNGQKNDLYSDDAHTASDILFFEPAIGIKYDSFSFMLGYKLFYTKVGTPTVTLKYYF